MIVVLVERNVEARWQNYCNTTMSDDPLMGLSGRILRGTALFDGRQSISVVG